MRKMLIMMAVAALAISAKADYWMTFCKTPGGQQYSQIKQVNRTMPGGATGGGGIWYNIAP